MDFLFKAGDELMVGGDEGLLGFDLANYCWLSGEGVEEFLIYEFVDNLALVEKRQLEKTLYVFDLLHNNEGKAITNWAGFIVSPDQDQ